MYNHYIPQSDGSHRRSSSDGRRPQPRPVPPPRPKPEPAPPPPPPEPKPQPPQPPVPCPPPPCQETPPQQSGIWDFLRGLLPRQIDTADLMILFLLLLMNQDCDDSLSPMLTVALYFLL